MLVISNAIVLRSYEQVDNPLIGYDQIVTSVDVSADTEADGFPASRVVTPDTYAFWKAADTTPQYFTVTTDGLTVVEYIAIAGHNFGTAQISVSIEKYLSGSWSTIESTVLPADDAPILWRVDPAALPSFRLVLSAGSEPARIGNLRAGSLLVMENPIWSGHAPIPYAFDTDVANGFSQSGKYLGRIVFGETRKTSAPFNLITPEWFRENMVDFLKASQEDAFYWVWRPDTYPDEVGYVVLTENIVPMNGDPSQNNLMTFELKMEGVA